MDFQGKLEGALSTLSGVVGNVSGKFESLAEPMSRFVEALSPGDMMQFGHAMRDLNATIGHAFLPVIQQLTKGASEAAAALVPAVQALEPIFGSLGESIKNLLVISVERMASVAQKAAPFLESLANGAKALVSIYDAMLSTLGGGDGLTSVFKTLAEWVTKFTSTLVVAVATIANSLGASGFGKKIAESLKGKDRAEGGLGAGITDAGTKGLDSFINDLTVAAQYAAGGEKKDPQTEALEKLLAQLEEINKNNTGFLEWLGVRKDSSFSQAMQQLFENYIIIPLGRVLNSMQEAILAKIPGWLRGK